MHLTRTPCLVRIFLPSQVVRDALNRVLMVTGIGWGGGSASLVSSSCLFVAFRNAFAIVFGHETMQQLPFPWRKRLPCEPLAMHREPV